MSAGAQQPRADVQITYMDRWVLVYITIAVGEIIVIAQLNSIWDRANFYLFSSHQALSPYLKDYFREKKFKIKKNWILTLLIYTYIAELYDQSTTQIILMIKLKEIKVFETF